MRSSRYRRHGRSANSSLLATSLAGLVIADFLLGRGLDEATLDEALALEDWSGLTSAALGPSMVAGHVYGWVARLDDAIDRLSRARDHAIALGQDSELPYIYVWLVAARCWKGELAEATSLADEALAIATVLVDPAAMAYADSAVAWAAAHTGDVRRAREHAGRALAFMEFARWHSSLFWPLGAFALVAAAEDDPESVERYLGPLTDAALAIGLEEPACAPFLPDRVEALVALGQLDRASELVAHWDADARRLDRDWALAAGARCRAALLVARHASRRSCQRHRGSDDRYRSAADAHRAGSHPAGRCRHPATATRATRGSRHADRRG